MKIVNRSQGTLLGSRILLADTWWQRFRGFLGRNAPASGDGILLAPCNSIHTFGMGFALDVVFLDPEGRVLGVCEMLRPWRTARGPRGTRYVLEVPIGTIGATRTGIGDELSWAPKQQVIWWSNPAEPETRRDSAQNIRMREGNA